MPFIKFVIRPKNELEKGGRASAPPSEEAEPSQTCPNCRRSVTTARLRANLMCCPECGRHFRIGARQRIGYTADESSFTELYPELQSADPLGFPGYKKKLETARAASGELESVITGDAAILGERCSLFAMDPNFMMGSMGGAAGEKITRLFEHAENNRLPVIGFTVSGGARMQEGIISLMQMAKTSGAVARLGKAGLPYFAVLTDPTTGGVTASFATEGDVIIAEPGATIGFAGARVIEQTTRRKLPKGFQTSEFLLEHGFIDMIAPRAELRALLARLIRLYRPAR